MEDDYDDYSMFADPGGSSALRASSRSNPRNCSCPRCKTRCVLTKEDKRHGYVCDRCANIAERGGDY